MRTYEIAKLIANSIFFHATNMCCFFISNSIFHNTILSFLLYKIDYDLYKIDYDLESKKGGNTIKSTIT